MEGNVALNQLVPQRILWDVDPTALNIDQSTASTLREIRVFGDNGKFGSLSCAWFTHFVGEQRWLVAAHEAKIPT